MSAQAALLTTSFLAEPALERARAHTVTAPELSVVRGRGVVSPSEGDGSFLLYGRYLEPSVGGPRRRGRRILGAYA